MANEQAGKTKTLPEILGFDPSKPTKLTAGIFADVVADVEKHRLDDAKKRATELLTKAMEMSRARKTAEAEFKKQAAKFDKEMGALLKQIQGMLDGHDEAVDETTGTHGE